MKILLVNKFLFPKGGDAISTLNTGKILVENGHEVFYWGMTHSNNTSYAFEEKFVKQSDFNRHNNIFEELRLARNLLYSFEAKKKIRFVLNMIKPEIVHLNNYAHQLSPSILHPIYHLRLPVVATLHDFKYVCGSYLMMNKKGTCEKCRNSRYFKCIVERCVKGSFFKSLLNTIEMYLHHNILDIYGGIQTLIAPSRFMIKKMKEMGYKSNYVLLPNFIDTSSFKADSRWQEKSVYFLGRLSKEKGLLTLLVAMLKMKDLELKIIGEGPQRAELEHFVVKHNMRNIKFLGYKSGKDLEKEIKRSIAMVMPSECYENNPLAVLESFAYGKPVIGAKIGGIPELVMNGKTGYTFEAGNHRDLTSTMQKMMKNLGSVTFLGANARRLVENNFCSEVYYRNLMTIYENAIEKKTHGAF